MYYVSKDSAAAETLWLTADDGVKLFVRRWIPQNSRAVLNIVHGMAEHSERYEQVALCLCEAGIEVWSADMRGHGKTADLALNPPGKGGLLGHCADNDGSAIVTADIEFINNTIIKTCPNIPLFLLGHSWGSFLVQNYIETYSQNVLAGCILSGTRGPDGLKIAVSEPIMRLIAAFKGCRNPSALAYVFADGPFSKPFRPNRTPFDWLSRDEKEVDAYFNDPLSGKRCSSGFYRDLTALLNRIHKPSLMSKIRSNLPIYVFAGSSDPVGDMGESPTKLVNAYHKMAISDLEFVLYPDARHETFNETNREEVIGNLVDWILKHCGVKELTVNS
ncbi:MAG: lysophospholipase [Treponema sp.]|jgi:alpha-beta hydrolase superfamily lysophospholipase|nr:lysophospholipase [Treponema sp.]